MKKGRTPKTYRCEHCSLMFFGTPFVYGPGTGVSKRNYTLMYLCSNCKDKTKPLKSGKPRKPNRIEDLTRLKREEYSKIPKSDLICEKCGAEFHGRSLTFTEKVKRKLVSTEVCLCIECQKSYLQNPEILNKSVDKSLPML